METKSKNGNLKIIIVGGVAGGASCAARLRRLDEHAQILMVERGPYVSYANCGLPYYVGGVIPRESSLLVADERTFRELFAIDVRTRCEAISISPENKTVELRNVATGEMTTESYDKLVLSPGATPIRPPMPGIDLPGVFKVRTVPDVKEIKEWLEGHDPFSSGMHTYTGYQTVVPAKRAVVVGGGFIGLEMAENLAHLGLQVTLVQRGDQLMTPMDPEMARYVERHMEKNGVRLVLNDGAAAFEQTAAGSLEVHTQSGQVYPADIVVLGIGVRPENWLAKNAGLEIGALGGIRVDDQMRTSDPDIFAVGDAVEVKDTITGQWSLVALAGPANRQGRIAADVIAGRDAAFRGTQGTSIIGLFGAAAAWTGVSEKTLVRLGETDYEKIYLYPNSHAGYYPGAKYLAMKVIFRKSDGRLLGAQAVGQDGVDKRIDALAMAIQLGATVYDLEEAELCYAPQFGSAKSPVNFAGMVAAGVLRGDLQVTHWNGGDAGFLLDVRHPEEIAIERVPDAVNIPLHELRARLGELPRDREIHVICRSGQRAYYATRILLQNGFNARNLAGGMLSRTILATDGKESSTV
jgi:NADPH-dependent 2,4-dienoyl-CoA reductase/sulfur reductase-like enzyme/rhodanese-related sulfurtransferase